MTVTSLDTGITIQLVPRMWCMCWVGVTGPNGETERLIDLAPLHVAALGLPGPGLYDVIVQPVSDRNRHTDTVLPDTSMSVK